MPTDWSESILIADLGDEPAFSEELTEVITEVERGQAGDASPGGDGEGPDVVIDMAQVSYLNSSNIAQLLRLRKQLVERNGRLRIASVQEPVQSVLAVTGLEKVFDFAPNKAVAIASLQIEQTEG